MGREPPGWGWTGAPKPQYDYSTYVECIDRQIRELERRKVDARKRQDIEDARKNWEFEQRLAPVFALWDQEIENAR